MERRRTRRERTSLVTLLFPFCFTVYIELALSLFLKMPVTLYKLLFALAAGGAALFLSRVIPVRTVGFILQSIFLTGCCVFVAADLVHFVSRGTFFSPFSASDAPPEMWFSALRQNWAFLLLMLPPLVFQFTLQRSCLLRRAGQAERFTGCRWMDILGTLLLAAALLFAAVTVPLSNDEGDPSPQRLLDLEYRPAESVAMFGALPTLALDVKYNVLGIHGEERVHYFVKSEDGTEREIDTKELAKAVSRPEGA